MNDYSEQIRIPSDFFIKTLKEYKDWKFAWFRETIQNSVDAGATQIDFMIESVNENTQIKLSVTDNGCGMNMTTLRNGLLTLGGSIKEKSVTIKEHFIEGYGYAKSIILFAHQQYQIHTRDLLVSGEGKKYVIEPADDYLCGTYISVLLKKVSPIAGFNKCCRRLVREYQTDLKITLNGKALQTQHCRYEHQLETTLGLLRFSEEKSNEVILCITIHGLPMFNYYLYDSGSRGLSGSLDLKGKVTELLTANHEALNLNATAALNNLLNKLIYQKAQFKLKK